MMDNIPMPSNCKKLNDGRPGYEIDEHQVKFLRSKHFTWAKIAKILGISDRTLRRKKQELSITKLYMHIRT